MDEWDKIDEDERIIEILIAERRALIKLHENIYGKKPNLNSIKSDLRNQEFWEGSQIPQDLTTPKNK